MNSQNKKSFYLFPFVLLLMLSLTVFSQTTTQPAQLSLADILIALRSKKAEMPEKNRILAEAVKVRGITFALTPEIEKELSGTGADKVLIDAIRQKSPVVKPVATPVKTQPTPVPTPSAFDIQRRANQSIAKGEFDAAITDYSKVIEMNSANSMTYLSRGWAYSNKQNYELAIADYTKSIELNPNESAAYLNRGEAYEKAGNIEKALADYQKAVELDDANEAAKNNLKRVQDAVAKAKEKEQNEANQQNRQDTAKTQTETTTTTTPQMVNLGSLNDVAVNLVIPTYPVIAQKSNITGKVTVRVIFDEEGKVISAKAVEGPSLLRPVSEDAARKSRFKPVLVDGQAVKATGFITYNFKGN